MKKDFDQHRTTQRAALCIVLLFIFLFPTHTRAALTDGLVGYWTFNGKDTDWLTGSVNDLSGQGNTGKVVNMSTTTSPVRGNIGQALKFNGTNQSVKLGKPSALQLTSNHTLSAWVNWSNSISAGSPDDDIVSGNVDQFLMSMNIDLGPRHFACLVQGATQAIRYSLTVPSVNKWYHVTCVYSASAQTLHVYVNGVLDDGTLSGTVPTSVNNTGSNYAIGERNNTNFWEGNIDDVHIYNRALSASEVQQLYKAGQAKQGVSSISALTSGLVGYWPFDGKDISYNYNIGKTDLTGGSNSDGNTLLAQPVTLYQTATIQSLSLYVSAGSGNIRLGIYDNTGPSGQPGTLKAETNSFANTIGWNTANVITPVTLSPGVYYIVQNDNAGLTTVSNATGVSSYVNAYAFGAMPGTFPASPSPSGSEWAFYATFREPANYIALDRSGQGNNGTIQYASLTGGRIGQGVQAPYGTTQTVNIGSPTAITNLAQKTVCAWVYPRRFSHVGSDTAFVSKQQQSTSYGWRILVADITSNIPSVYFLQTFTGGNAVWYAGANAITLNRWSHVCVVYDDSSASNSPTFYIDGKVTSTVSQLSSGTVQSDSGGNFEIGNLAGSQGNSLSFDGKVDDVRVYNRLLSAAEVKQIYEQGQTTIGASQTQSLTSGLVGYWTFDGKDVNWSTGRVVDSSGNNNTGSLISMSTTTTPITGKVGQGLKLDGVNDSVNVASTISGVKTVSFWMKGSSNTQKILDLNGTASIEVISGTITANNFTSPTRYVDGIVSSVVDMSWHLVTITTATGISASAITLGKIGAGFFAGTLDDIRFYSRELSASEVQQLYKAGTSVAR